MRGCLLCNGLCNATAENSIYPAALDKCAMLQFRISGPPRDAVPQAKAQRWATICPRAILSMKVPFVALTIFPTHHLTSVSSSFRTETKIFEAAKK